MSSGWGLFFGKNQLVQKKIDKIFNCLLSIPDAKSKKAKHSDLE